MIAAEVPPAFPVTMSSRAFAPAHASVLVGESVTWTNTDEVAHTVSGDGLASGRLPPGATFSHRFEHPGVHRYLCTIHRSMRGQVEVATLALTGPRDPVPAGASVGLSGRAPAGSGTVELVRDGAGVVASAQPAADGSFAFRVTADAPVRFRARAGALSSGAVAVRVAPAIHLTAARAGGRVTVRIHVPSQGRAGAILERHERERFGYVRLRKVRLDAAGRAVVRLRTSRRLRLRLRLFAPVGGYARTAGEPVVVPRHGTPGHAGHH